MGLRDNITRDWRKLHNEVLRNLCCTHRIIEVIKLRKICRRNGMSQKLGNILSHRISRAEITCGDAEVHRKAVLKYAYSTVTNR